MTQGGKTLTSGYVQSYGFWVVQKQLESVTNDISLTNEIGQHKITLGSYQSFWSSQDFWTIGNHVLVQNVANGDIIKNVSPDSVAGSWNYGLNEAGDSRMTAVYAGDSWQMTEKLRLDLGARYDFFNLNFTLDAGSWPDGTIDKVANLDGNDWAGTGALNYQFTDNIGVFVRGSKGSLFPNFDQVRDGDLYNLKSGTQTRVGGNVTSVKGTVKPNLFNQFELGFKVDQELYSLFITGFLNTVEVYDGDVGATRVAALLKTRTLGTEIDAGLYVDAFRLNLIATIQSGKITESAKAPETVGNKIWRQPDFQLRVAPSYDFPLSNSITASLYGAFRYVGKRWDDRDNAFQLDAFTKLDFGINVATSSGITFNVSGDNLGDSHGLTEGDPRDPNSSNGRPILGRSIRFAIGVNF
jgi:outer membrane receptor for monomeric catechols